MTGMKRNEGEEEEEEEGERREGEKTRQGARELPYQFKHDIPIQYSG